MRRRRGEKVNMEFTLKEKLRIAQAYKTVIKDLDLIFKKFKPYKLKLDCCLGKNDIFDSVFGFKSCDCYIEFDDCLYFRTMYEGTSVTRNRVTLATIDKNGDLRPCYSDYLLCGAFVKEYPKFREKIIKEIDQKEKPLLLIEKHSLKEEILSDLLSVQNRFSNSSDILIDLPPSQNQHRLVVKKENGRNVGTLDFGNATIRLITDGQITLVKEQDKDVKDLKKR